MSSFNRFADRNRDQQDGIERHIFAKLEKVDKAGHIVRVKGNGTEDEEAVYLCLNGLGFNWPEDTEAEVHLLSMGSDTNAKFALVCIPRDKERDWPEKSNGVQKWDDPRKFLQFGDKKTQLADKNVAIGDKGQIEVKDGKVYVRGDLYVDGEVRAKKDIHTPTIRSLGSDAPITPDIPAFEGEGEA